jgi:hypothetical protein
MLEHNSVNSINVAWRKAIRRGKLPYKTHSALLPRIARQLPINICKNGLLNILYQQVCVTKICLLMLYLVITVSLVKTKQ